MVFSNAVFLLLFFPITLLVYYFPFVMKRMNLQNIWLLLVSLVFYAWGEPLYILLMMLSICVNYFFGRMVSSCPKAAKGKRIVAAACIYNLGVLFVFKYLSWILGSIGLQTAAEHVKLALPIGISFYTFQALSYVIDVYRGKDEAQTSIINVGLYIAFFPQLIAGPIVRYGSIAEQLKNRSHTMDKFSQGAWRFTIGLSKKILLANQLAKLADLAFRLDASERSVALAWAGALAFMLQIYFDFSGYSDMAIGLGKMFGFEFAENFNYPYISKSITEYWRRWHISLGEWFRDYLYYPLSLGPALKIRKAAAGRFGRKKAGIISNFFVLFVTWMATGIWHGANWTFVVWGLIQFVCIFAEQYRKPLKNKRLGAVLGFITTFLIVLITKVVFNSDSIGQAVKYYGSMLHLSGNAGVDAVSLYWLNQFKVVLIVSFFFAFPVMEKLRQVFRKYNKETVWNAVLTVAMVGLLIIDISYAIGGGYNPFIYFNF